MTIRKEQVLALLVLGISGLIWKGLGAEAGGSSQLTPKRLEYTAAAVVAVPLAGAATGGFARRELFTEPRETRALPPRDLAFPPHAPLSVAALPLEPGPDYAHALLLRDDGAIVADVVLQAATEAAPADAAEPDPSAQNPGTGPGTGPGANRAMLAQTYDQLFFEGLSAPYYGFVEVVGVNPFDAEKMSDFEGQVVQFRQYSQTTGKIGRIETYDRNNLRKVRSIKLADTLRNDVARHIREVPMDAVHLDERGHLISWLLGKAREAAWVYDDALQQAEAYSQVSAGALEGLRWQLRVLQAKGDLAGEFALLEGITGEHRDSAFRLEGLGLVKAKLGLWSDAEQDLRRAVELGRNDARPCASLAAFLCSRGRSSEAVAIALRAQQTMGVLTDTNDKARVVRAIVASQLAVGDLDAARAALSLLPSDRPQPYLVGCVAYASGDLPAALEAFRQASVGEHGSAALLGQGAVLLRQQQWQDAHDAFVAVADQAPLLRHRAWSGLALLYQRIGQFDNSIVWADRALEADPQDPYSYYVRGRTLRLQGQLVAAQEALTSSLRLRDDFVHAVAEMAAVQSALASDARGEEQASSVLRAMKYGGRAVDLAFRPTVELFEQEGLYQFVGGSVADAKASFEKARDTAADDVAKRFAKGAIAVVDYSRGQLDDAVAALQRFSELPKDDVMRKWAEETLQAIEDHAQKEMLEDRFERSDVGGIWPLEKDGTLGAVIKDNRLVFQGKFNRTGEVSAERSGAVQRARNFLAVGCTMQFGKNQPRNSGFAGLRIETQRGSTGQPDSQIMVGIREGKPHVRIVDNREEPKVKDLEIPGFDVSAPQELELRLVPRGEQTARAFALQVRWNGVVMLEQELKGLGGSSGNELRTILFVSGNRGSDVDVAFDDYRLERRKEIK
jgi:tetratricopeptide (TPR) repeat protein